MAKITRKELTNGKWMTWISTDGLNTEIAWYDHEPTEKDATEYLAKREARLLSEVKTKEQEVAEVDAQIATLTEKKVQLSTAIANEKKVK